MINQKKKVELLAPAGNMEGFLGAIHAGADAVYLGGKLFGARAYADNFTEEELLFCIHYAHLWGRRVYLTVNTLTRNQELAELEGYLSPLYEAGLDGVIIQDMGVFQYIARNFPGLELHVSTQMTITDVADAAYLKELGAQRIVPARELSLDEIHTIKEATNLEIECFIHGAMCYAYSGQCLFSSILGGRSGNRGRCAQPCRLPYQVTANGRKQTGEYPLSLKDMCTLGHIPELIEAGINSFKIEGRMKKPEYTAGVTAIYRKYIDLYYNLPSEKKSQFKVEQADLDALNTLYIRSEKQDGYYYKHNGRDMVTLDSPSYNGTDEAQLSRIRRDYIETSPKIPLSLYAYLEVGSPAILCLTLHSSSDINRQSTPASHGLNQAASALSVSVEGPVVSLARKQPLTTDTVEKQLHKLGNTIFEIQEAEIYVGENCFYSVKELNELRREAIARLEEQLILAAGLVPQREYKTCSKEAPSLSADMLSSGALSHQPLSHGNTYTLACQTMEQLRTVKKLCKEQKVKHLGRLIIEGDLLIHHPEELQDYIRSQSLQTLSVYIALPYIIRKRDNEYLQKLFSILEQTPEIAGVLVRNISELAYLKHRKYNGEYWADGNFYLWNKESISFWQKELTCGTFPYELNSAQQKELLQTGFPMEKLIYGRLPMMISAGCVQNTTAGCGKKEAFASADGFLTAELTDRYQKHFPVQLCCSHCYNIIYNSLPLSLHKEISKWYGKVGLRLHMTTENGETTKEILTFYDGILDALKQSEKSRNKGTDSLFANLTIPSVLTEYTTGHEKRGVE